jgi:hypothetical protein
MQNKFIIVIMENLNEILMDMKTTENFNLEAIVDIEVLYYAMQAWLIDAKPFIEMFDEGLEEQGITDVINFIKEMREEVEDGKNSTQRNFS